MVTGELLKMLAYYNDNDKDVCLWLDHLIKNGDITKGHVDDRSIQEVKPEDFAGYDRVHFFAGIGTWDYALNQAGWGDRPVWTASLPCQPFSAAGKGYGYKDDRHLLPAYFDLVKKCRPDIQIGEQVGRAIKYGWLDDLQTNMEAEGYAIGHCILGAHSVDAAHIRQRLYWVGNAEYEGLSSDEIKRGIGQSQVESGVQQFERSSSDIEWLYCRDGKYRPIKSGIKPLVDGSSGKLVHSRDTGASIEANNTQEARTMRLKGYGNAIQADLATEFIKAFMQIT